MIYSRVKTRDGDETITAYTYKEFKPVALEFAKKSRNKQTYQYCIDYGTFDSETSHTDIAAWIYQWAFKFKDTYYYGRRPSEFIELLKTFKRYYKLTKKKKILIYIHNESYDIQYLKHYLYEYDNDMHVLAIDKHQYLITDIEGFRIICSWKLSNLSLDLFAETYGKKYLKASGEIDYQVIRYQDTELSDSDWYYMFSDVASQHDAIHGLLESQGYSRCFDAPYTSTGFVRTDCRHAAEKSFNWRKYFKRSQLALDQYKLCKQGFMGGLTICSYNYAGETVTGDLGHKDFTSSYPARQMMDYFPKGAPIWYGDIDSETEFNDLLNTYCCVFLLTLYKVQIKEGVTAPCIPSSKCIKLKDPLKVNGKVVYAEEVSLVVTEIDYKWIDRQYEIEEFEVDKMLIFERGEIPKWMKEQIMKYFEYKCTLKHSDPKLYLASKGKLNGIYGMTATSIIRQSLIYNEELILIPKDQDDERELNKYYGSRNSFLPYQYSLYTTAWARDALLTMIECVGYENFLYCDTDSVFYIKTWENEKRLKEYAARCKERAIKAGAYINDNYLGYPTDEKPITAFRALHAKCYAMIENGELKVIIAGITKKATKWVNGEPVTMTNAEELGSVDNLQDGFIFKYNGGTRAIYIEDPARVELINGHELELASGVIIEPVEKEINDTMFTVGEDYELLHINMYETL